jgi:peptide chain release factor 2
MLESIFEIEKLNNLYESLKLKIESPDFWQDKISAKKTIEEFNILKQKISPYLSIYSQIEEIFSLLEITSEEEKDILKEIFEEVKKIKREIENLELHLLFSEKYDRRNAILSIHAGAGGKEACDWVDILTRMYLRYAEKKKFQTEVVDLTLSDIGTKSITIIIEGDYAYGYFKSEKGVHRMVRISPFDANKRRHTTFAAVDVIPEIEENKELKINPEDLRIETFRASGAGGQHVNKTSSAVRITHLPTGIVVSCQSERSQFKNKQNALKILYSRVYRLMEEEKKEKIKDLRGELTDIAWGHQIRSYIFHPYNLIKDHRTEYETSDVGRVMDGDLEDFIISYLKKNVSKRE